MTKIAEASKKRPRTLVVAGLALLFALVGGTVAATEYTSRPEFCTSCHEMTPYYTAWDAGAHSGVSCVACHVDPGLKAQLSHKVVALKEVYVHFASDPTFPGAVTDIPDDRCLACHDGTINTGVDGFSHDKHRSGRSCVDCHAGAGHKVTTTALAEAGILNTTNANTRELLSVASVGAGKANLEDHKQITCSSCHDLAATGCTSCHETPAEHREGTCVTCHGTGATWTFEHPDAKAACTDCHTRPEPHSAKTCTTCHTTGATWTFEHPDAKATCTDCHTRPEPHSAKTCTTCHTTGAAWKFQHPSSKACAECHKAPSKHYPGTCSTCHTPSTAFASAKFRHPGSGSTCTSCHSKPGGHYSASCSSCHKTGVSWKFQHPSSKSCASCHKAPSKHYGTTCVSCHTPTKSWKSATFSHPRVPGGEHSYKSFACASCHPSGYSSISCTKCHDSNEPDD